MTLFNLLKDAHQALSFPGHLRGVMLTIPKGKMPPGFPRGELLNEMTRDGVVERTYLFKPEKIIAWVKKNFGIETISEVTE